MEDELDSVQNAPATKRQRTDDGPVTLAAGDGAGTGAAAEGKQPNGGQNKNQRQQQQQKCQGGRRKGGKDHRIAIMHQAVKRNNFKFAMKLFGEAKEEGAVLPTPVINSLMYLACGAEQWERYVRGLPPLSPEEAEAAEAAAGGAEGGEAGEAVADAAEGQQAQMKPQGRKERPHVPPPEGPPPTREELVAAADELWSYMCTNGLKPDHTTYLALARREALQGDPKASLHWASECTKKGLPVALRLFHPAQVRYCMAADVAALHDIDGLIAAHQLDPTEYEFARLLEGIAAGPGTYEQLKSVLTRMQSDLNQLHPATTHFIAAFFDKQAAAAQQAFAPPDQGGCPLLAAAMTASDGTAAAADASLAGGVSAGWRWRVVRDVAVAGDGRCEAAGGCLRVIDLEDKDWEAFAAAIAELARRNMGHRAPDFDAYVQWYDRNGPYDVLVDAANVAFYGGSNFNWVKVQDMYDMLRRRFEGKKILVVVHRKRINDLEAHAPGVQAFLEQLRRTKSFYHTPPGANDDWFWLYACVRAKRGGLLVSNDELRDHIFSLLRPKHFLKWKERHIAHYTFAAAAHAHAPPGGMFSLSLPAPYTACVQQLPESGAWMLPISGGAWVCVRPERVAAA